MIEEKIELYKSITLNRWDWKDHKYYPYTISIPINEVIVLAVENMDAEILCPTCRRKIKFGESYTSMELHSDYGFGYPVCKKCYYEEWDRRNKYKNTEDL